MNNLRNYAFFLSRTFRFPFLHSPPPYLISTLYARSKFSQVFHQSRMSSTSFGIEERGVPNTFSYRVFFRMLGLAIHFAINIALHFDIRYLSFLCKTYKLFKTKYFIICNQDRRFQGAVYELGLSRSWRAKSNIPFPK